MVEFVFFVFYMLEINRIRLGISNVEYVNHLLNIYYNFSDCIMGFRSHIFLFVCTEKLERRRHSHPS